MPQDASCIAAGHTMYLPRTRSTPRLNYLQKDRQQRNEYDQQHHFLKILPDNSDLSETVARQRDENDPARAADQAKAEKPAVPHTGYTGHEWRARPDNGNESRIDDGLSAVPFEECTRLHEMIGMEQTRLRTVENHRSRAPAEKISYIVAEDSGTHQQRNNKGQIEISRPAHHAHCEQQRIPWKKEPHKQPGFREYNPAESRVPEPTREHSSQQSDQLLGIGQRP